MRDYLLRDRKMRNNRFHIVIIIISVFFLICIFSVFLSNGINQAKANTSSDMISEIFVNIINKGSGTLSYQLEKEKNLYHFPVYMISRIYQVHRFVSADTRRPKDKYVPAQRAVVEVQSQKSKSKINYINYSNVLTKEYILTNGAILKSDNYIEYIEGSGSLHGRLQELPVSIMDGDLYYNDFDLGYGGDEGVIGVMKSHDGTPFTLNQLNDVSFLIRNFYIVDSATRITDELFDAKVLLEKDMTIKTSNDKPQILIYHTHSQEAYLDSRKQEPEDSVVGIGSLLAEILTEKYGYNVIHDKSVYDLVDGKLDRNKAYTYAREGVLKILEENPSIEVVIDLHRDGAEKRSTVIEGQETAQIMLLNGLSRNQNGPITRLDNPNLQDNLSFSLQLQLKGLKMYPGLFYKNYLQDYRYNLDVRPKSLLVELGTHKNTLRSAKKAMEPFAEILDAVLKGQ